MDHRKKEGVSAGSSLFIKKPQKNPKSLNIQTRLEQIQTLKVGRENRKVAEQRSHRIRIQKQKEKIAEILTCISKCLCTENNLFVSQYIFAHYISENDHLKTVCVNNTICEIVYKLLTIPVDLQVFTVPNSASNNHVRENNYIVESISPFGPHFIHFPMNLFFDDYTQKVIQFMLYPEINKKMIGGPLFSEVNEMDSNGSVHYKNFRFNRSLDKVLDRMRMCYNFINTLLTITSGEKNITSHMGSCLFLQQIMNECIQFTFFNAPETERPEIIRKILSIQQHLQQKIFLSDGSPAPLIISNLPSAAETILHHLTEQQACILPTRSYH